jgi:hypothetical protein
VLWLAASGKRYVDEGLYYGDDREATLINPLLIEQLATFSIGKGTYWLVRSEKPEGVSSLAWRLSTGQRRTRAR